MWTSWAARHAWRRRAAGALAGLLAIAGTLAAWSPAEARIRDRDGDGISNRGERKRTHTNPRRADTDRDHLRDRFELKRSRTNPRRRDTDRDGLRDRFELKRSRTNPRRRDTDRDGLRDRFEWRRSHTNPRRADTDRDGLKDGFELRRSRTNPRRKDTDRDGYSDGMEVLLGSNPRSRKSVPRRPRATPTWRCDRSANPSTLRGQVNAARPGETICLATGGYGTFEGTNKAITIRAARGAAPTMRYEFGSGDSGFALVGLRGTGGRSRSAPGTS